MYDGALEKDKTGTGKVFKKLVLNDLPAFYLALVEDPVNVLKKDLCNLNCNVSEQERVVGNGL